MADVSGDVVRLIIGAVMIVFWRQIGLFGSWSQERTWRYPRGALTTGRNLRNTQILVLLVGIVMIVTTLMSLAS